MMKTLEQISTKAQELIFAISLFLLPSTPAAFAQSSFTKITNGPIATDFEQSVGCAWGDYDNDGFVDLFVTHFDRISMNTLYHNERNGTFTRFAAGAPANEVNVRSSGCAWGDYDNDGFLDLFVANLGINETNWLYRNIGNGTFQKMTGVQAGSIVSDPAGRSVSAAWGDVDADGYLDLFVANGAFEENNVDALYRNLGQGRGFINIAATSGLSHALKSTQGTWADVDGDRRLDLFVTHYDNQGNYVYRNLGGGAFEAIADANALNEQLNSVGSAWGDYDNDGDLDLFVVSRPLPGGPLHTNNFYRNNGGGIFEKIGAGDIVSDVGVFNSCAWADYDNDGHLDLFVTNEESPNRLYHNSGDGTFLSITQGDVVTDTARSNGCAWGDYDNDGFLDLFVANGGAIPGYQQNFLYRNNRNSNHWIKVRCVGTLSNRSAIGAIVQAKALVDGVVRWQMRHISGGDGWLSQNSLDVSIGFGTATNIDLLRIEWPSGIVQEFQNVAVDQTLVVEEPSRIALRSVGAGFELALKGGGRDASGRFRRYDIEASADLTGWSMLTNVLVSNADGTATVRGISSGATNRFYRARRSASE